MISLITLGLLLTNPTQPFEEPFRVKADGQYITVDLGHAAPNVMDWDGDGVRDLIVGQFDGGKLRIYKNYGTDRKPVFRDFKWFEINGAPACVDAG